MGERVRELRKALGLSGERFGEKIGVKKSAVSKIESGLVEYTCHLPGVQCKWRMAAIR